ncbi:hypothetical protein TWF173_001852 [Orbilia oligospora]|nr:hypothetical protein TWF173_001852 [Orbilia oligospora]
MRRTAKPSRAIESLSTPELLAGLDQIRVLYMQGPHLTSFRRSSTGGVVTWEGKQRTQVLRLLGNSVTE